MLSALQARGVRADFVVGSSAGAINAAYFASRPDLEGARALSSVWRGLRRSDVFPLSPLSAMVGLLGGARRHLVNPDKLRRLLELHLPCDRIECTAIPLHLVTTDLLTGQEVLLSRGDLVDAVLASAAIPSVFPPVPVDGRYLADGGLANNTPISAAVALGADRVIVLPTGSSCMLAEPPPSVLGMALHGISLLISRQLVSDIARLGGSAELHIVPPPCPIDVSPVDFSRCAELIDLAESTTCRWLDGGGLERCEIPSTLLPHDHAIVHQARTP